MSRWFKSGVRVQIARVLTVAFSLAFLLSLFAATPTLAAPNTAGVNAAPQAKVSKPVVRNALKHDKTPALKTMKPKHVDQGKLKATTAPTHPVPHGNLKDTAKSGTADVQQSVVTNNMPSTQQNFEGVGNVNGVRPPDTQGDVGPNNYVQMVNLSFAIWDKQGNLLYGPVPNTTLWQGFGGFCESFNGGDPITMYDEAADRWFMSQLAYPGGANGYHECIAVSQTGDPTGAWYRYDFLYSPDSLNDYPKFGIWNDAYYMSANEFLDGATFNGAGVVAFERAKMLAGQDARSVYFHVGDSSGIYGNLLPTDAEGQALGFNPPAGAPDPFLMFDDDAWGFSPTDRLLMWDFHVDWSNPANSTFGNNGAPNRYFETEPFDSNLCNYNRSCIPQPGTSVGLDSLADRLMSRASYRNFGDHQAIVLNQSVDTNGSDHAGVRWYELANPGSGWTLDQQGTYAPDSDNRWMGSAAIDASGDIAIGYSVSSSTTFPSIRLAGRLASDPPGELSQGETTLMAGGGSATDGLSRWGDYSSMQVDPTDGCTFWFTSEYMATTSLTDWHTRVGSFKFPSCTAGPHGTLTGTVTDASSNNPIVGAMVSTTGASTTTDDQGHYALTLPVGAYDVTFSAFGYATKVVNGIQISDGGTTTQDAALTPMPSVHVTGTVTDGSGHGWPIYTRIEITGLSAPIYTDPATGHYSVDLPQNAVYQAKFTATLPGYQVVNDTIPVGTGDVTHDVAIPVLASCTAPGYGFSYGTPVLNEPFDGSAMPAGWTVVDNVGQGHVWQIGDPENRGNLTGGTGNFADINSDFYGSGNHQDTSLVSPVIDLSGASSPILRFHNDYNGFPNQIGDVDITTDGGGTWSNIWHHGSDSVRGPDLEEAAMAAAGGQSQVQIRFHFVSTWGWWWMVDDVSVLNRACTPTPGGLVVGTVSDANTGNGINGATVTSTDKPDEKATTTATPDDSHLGDGYYWLFSSLTGSHPFSATKPPYESASATVNVAADGATRADFSLKAGRLTIDPQSVSSTQVLGDTATKTVKFTNTGGAPVNVRLAERAGTFQILTMQGSPLKLVTGDADDPDPYTPEMLAGQHMDDEPSARAGAPRDPTWSTVASYPTGIMDNGADIIDGKVYSVGGVDSSGGITAKAFVYDPATNTWAAIADTPVAREKPAVAAVNGKLYVTGGWNSAGNPVAQTDVYDPATNTWSTVAANPTPTAGPGVAVANGKIYLVGGCLDGNCTPGAATVVYDPGSDSWATVASYPHTNSWESCGGIDGKVYCAGGTAGNSTFKDGFAYDPSADTWTAIASLPIDLWASASGAANGVLIASGGVTNGFSTVTNQGYAYDPSSDTWTAIPNAQFPRYRAGGSCGFYKVGGSSGGFTPTPDVEHLSELDQCGVTDVPWLAEDQTSFSIQPGQSVTVTVTLSATTAAQVVQPGTYTAQLGVSANTPYTVNPVNVTMTVTPPKGWGKIAGTVTGTSCNGNTAPLRGAQIQINAKGGGSVSLKTDANGNYAYWVDSKVSQYTVIASKDGWITQVANKISVKAGKTTTVNFNLSPTTC